MSASIVSGIFDDYGVVKKLVDKLRSYGFKEQNISILGSKQEEALILKNEVHPSGNPRYLSKSVLFGAFAGAIFASICLLFFHSSTVTSILATVAGTFAGAYLGLLAGAISRFDITEDSKHFKEEDMTAGRIWVGVITQIKSDQELCQKTMGDLGVIRLDPASPIYDEHWTNTAFLVSSISGAIFLLGLALLVPMAAHRSTDASTAERIVLFICFGGLLLDTAIIAIAGLQTRGANKWLKFDVEGAIHDELQ